MHQNVQPIGVVFIMTGVPRDTFTFCEVKEAFDRCDYVCNRLKSLMRAAGLVDERKDHWMMSMMAGGISKRPQVSCLYSLLLSIHLSAR